MADWKLPPRAKVYEALSALADERVKLVGSTEAEVVSSTGDKAYRVIWSDDMRKITSNDNASHWQGYIGYPIIAVLLRTGKISVDQGLAGNLSGIPWKRLNDDFRRDYDRVIQHVLSSLSEKGLDSGMIDSEVDRIMAELKELNLERLPAKGRPPKEGSR